MAGKTDKASASDVVAFMPAVTFFGYPDGVTKVDYFAGKPAKASAEYVALLREKGLVADNGEADDKPADVTTQQATA